MFILVLIAPLVILNRILRHETIGMETILGAICVYVLLGDRRSPGIYAGINDVEPLGFFAQQPGPKTNVDFLYFSFITLTTVGLRRPHARAPTPGACVVTFEALIGQMFLVTLVARLVSACTAQAAPRAPDERPASRARRSSEQLGHLERVERGALAQVVAGDPEVERVRPATGPRAAGRRAPGRCPRASSGVGAPSPPSTSRTPGARASSSTASAARQRRARTARWPTSRGRRTPAPARRWR